MKMTHSGQNEICSGTEPCRFHAKISGRKFVYKHIESAAERKHTMKWSAVLTVLTLILWCLLPLAEVFSYRERPGRHKTS